MSDKAPAFKFTTNVPVQSHIRFIDVRAGKLWDDPKTGQTKKLPAQVSIKGTFSGADTICFLPGPAWKNIKALADGGVIDAEGMEIGLTAANDEALATNVSIPVKDGKVMALLAKPAGERYENMTFTLLDAPAAPVSKRLTSPPRKSFPFDEGSFPPEDAVYAVAPQDHMPVRQANMPNLSAPAPTDGDAPEWVTAPARTAGVAPDATKKLAYISAYLDLLGYVRAHSGLKDEVAIQACAATLHIGLKQEGLR